jgi:hypothetical protein
MLATPADLMLQMDTPACCAHLTSVKPRTTLDLIATMLSNISTWAIPAPQRTGTKYNSQQTGYG